MKTFHAAFLPLFPVLFEQKTFLRVQFGAFCLEYFNSQGQSMLSEKIQLEMCDYIVNFLSMSLCFQTGVKTTQDDLF